MGAVLAAFGGLLVLISLVGGALGNIRLVPPGQSLAVGDRIAAALIGTGLIATAVVLRIDGPTVSLVSTFGVTVALTLLYCLYLLVTR